MRKDVIYVDVEDDITSILGKVKAAGSDIVALVPPKRSGALQSAVNLKLLQKGAAEVGKRLVLVTSDNLLTSLAAGIKIPVAKNLQSRPEIPTLGAPKIDDDETIVGAELPVGEIAKAAGEPLPESAADEIAKRVELDGQSQPDLTAPAPEKPIKKTLGKFGNVNVPDFNKFRKRLFIGGAAIIVVAGFLFWALVVAPKAVVTITATTSSVDISRTLNLQPSLGASKIDALQLKPISQQIQDTESVNFTPTGSKDIGDKATGTITIRNCDYPSGFTLASGTNFVSASGLNFVSTAAVSVPQFTGPAHNCSLGGSSSGQATVNVQATNIGTDYNIAAQAYTITGLTGNVDAVGSAMAGGTKQTVTVVSQDDFTKAQTQLNQQISQAAGSFKTKLQQQFGADQLVIVESLNTSAGNPSSSPDVGQQGQAGKLTIQTTYTMLGLARSDITQVLAGALNQALTGKTGQSVFDDGSNTIQFQAYQQLGDGSYSVVLTTSGRIGPTINSKQIATQIEGKRYGEALQVINQIPGVDKVNVQLSPFWVTSVPSDPKKLTLKFSIVNGGN